MRRVASRRGVWRALASPVRRRILDRLRDNPRTTGQLAAAFPKLSRFAVMQHLGVLVESKLVLVERRGRERLNYLNAAPIHTIHQRWVNQFAHQLASSADALKTLSEGKTPMSKVKAPHDESFRSVDLEFEYEISAPPSRVWEIITQRTAEWWRRAEFFTRRDAVAFHIEPHAGGRMWEEHANGGSLLWWTINEIEVGKVLGFTGQLTKHYGGPSHEQIRIELVSKAAGQCTVKLNHVSFGRIDDLERHQQVFGDGWTQLFMAGLKPLAERN